MVKFTLEENWEILKTFFQSGESSAEIARKLRSKFEKNKAPSRQFVDSFVKRVRGTGSLMDKTTRLPARPVRSVENIAAVAEIRWTIRRRQLGTDFNQRPPFKAI